MPLLELKGVTKNFGKLQAVSGLDFRVEKGEIHSLIGPNGAGKTTVFNLITGTFPVTSGAIILDGERHHRPRAAPNRPEGREPLLPANLPLHAVDGP